MKYKWYKTTHFFYFRISICAVLMAIIFILSGKSVFAADTMDMKSQLSDIFASEDQVIIVSQSSAGHGTLYFFIKPETEWKAAIIAPIYTGKNGIDKTKEGDLRTPTGVFRITKAFGIAKDPGCIMPYTQVDSSHWWVSDPASDKYNQFVSTKDTPCTWNTAKGEHLIKAGKAYNYVLSIDYNSQCVPNAGSAIFIHCEYGKPTSGCVALPVDAMKLLIQNVKQNCPVCIDYADNITTVTSPLFSLAMQ